MECSSGNFDAVEDTKVKETLYATKAELDGLKGVRKAILEAIKTNDVKEKRNNRKF